jgi:hypothetical protein
MKPGYGADGRMTRLSAMLAAVLLLACLPWAATAADLKIGDVSLRLPLLPGHCAMDAAVAADAPLVANVHRSLSKTGSRLLLLTLDCAEHKEFRSGKRSVLGHMAQYQTVLALENRPLPEAADVVIDRYCVEMRASAEKSMPGTKPDAIERAEEASRLVRVGEVKYLGVLAQEPIVCYAATIHKFMIENAGEFTHATVIAATVVKGKVLICYLFAPYAGRGTLPELLTKQRRNIGQLQKANHS